MKEQSAASARWGNLTLEERLMDRLSAIVSAADHVVQMIDATAADEPAILNIRMHSDNVACRVRRLVMDLRPYTVPAPLCRDPEIEAALVKIDGVLSGAPMRHNVPLPDADWEEAQRLAAHDAMSFYFEIRRMDNLLLWGELCQPHPVMPKSGTETT